MRLPQRKNTIDSPNFCKHCKKQDAVREHCTPISLVGPNFAYNYGGVAIPSQLDLNGNPIFANVLVTSDPGIKQVVISYTPQDPLYQFQTSVDIKTGFVPAGGNTEFKTTIKQDGVDITSLINIDYANNLIVYPGNSPGNVTNYPPDGAVISIEMTQTIYGTRQEIEGGVVTADTLRKKGWIVRTE